MEPKNPSGTEQQNTDDQDEKLIGEGEAAVDAALRAEKQEHPSPLDELTDGPTVATGIQTGQTSRGAYSTDPATGAGGYRDHRSGTFGTEEVAQPGNDEEREPDQLDKGF